MTTLLSFILVIIILVFVHELGHFLAAKKARMKVEEFAIGFRPALFEKKIGETNYILGVIPIGGYVKIFGENTLEAEKEKALLVEDEKVREKKLLEIENTKDKAFSSKNRFWQATVLSAGVIFNFIFAYLIFLFMVFSQPFVHIHDVDVEDKKYLTEQSLAIKGVVADSVAEKEGLPQEAIIKEFYIDKVKQDLLSVDLMDNILNVKEEIKITYIEKSDAKSIDFVEKNLEVSYDENGQKEKFGIYFAQQGKIELPFWKNFEYAWKSFWSFFMMTVDGFKNLFTGGMSIDDVSGPVGIAKISGQAFDVGLNSFLTLLAVLSINLGIINILPFPALDGGRLLIVIIESVIRKRIAPVIVNSLNGLGFLLLIGFMIFITYKDIINF